MHRRGIEDQVAGVADLIDFLVLGVMLLELDESLADHDVVVLVGAHEAAQHHLAGHAARVGQRCRLRTEDDGVLLPLLHVRAALHGEGIALDVERNVLSVPSGHGSLEEVCLADEVRHELVDRVVVDFLRRTHLRHDALGHDDDVVGQGHGLGLVVGDIDGGDADLLLDAADLRAHRDAQLRVEV